MGDETPLIWPRQGVVHFATRIDTNCGAPGPARTGGLRIRSPTLYPTELRALGVSEGTRTLDHWGHNPVLYPTELHSPLNYSHQ